MKHCIVLDIEASGLSDDSYPIEIAWASLHEASCDTFLMKPARDWIYWDDIAQHYHGLSREAVVRAGLSPPEAIVRLEEGCKGKRVYSDAPEWDGFWLDRLYNEAHMPRTWRLRSLDSLMLQTQEEYSEERMHRALSDAIDIAHRVVK